MKDGPRLSSIIADWSSIDSIKSRSKIWTRPRVALRAKSALGARVRVTLGVALEMKPAGLLLPFRFRFQPRPHSDWSAIQKRPITSRLPPFFLSDVLTQGPHKKKGKKRRIVAILKCLFFPVCLFLVHRKRGTNRSKWKRNRERERETERNPPARGPLGQCLWNSRRSYWIPEASMMKFLSYLSYRLFTEFYRVS